MTSKPIINILIVFILGLLIYFLVIRSSHSLGHAPDKYSWIFNDSIRYTVEKNISTIESRKEDTLSTYYYKQYVFTIFKISKSAFNPDSIYLQQNFSFNEFENSFYGELLNTEVYPFPEVWISYNMNFRNKIGALTDDSSKIDTIFNTPNYKGFIGNIHKLGLKGSQQNLVMFDYKLKPTRTLCLLLKHKNLIILANSQDNFGYEVLDLFNLDTNEYIRKDKK